MAAWSAGIAVAKAHGLQDLLVSMNESLGEYKRPTAVDTEFGTGPSQHDFETRLFADLDPALRRWAIERCTPHPIATMRAPVKLASFWDQSWNASVIWCKRSANPPVAHQRRCADRLEARWHELDTGHYPMLSEPEALARLIVEG